MKNNLVVSWSVVEFPAETRAKFAEAAKVANFTTSGLMEDVLKGWFSNPEFPEVTSFPEGTELANFCLPSFPAVLKNRFVGSAFRHRMNTGVLLAYVVERFLARLELNRA